MYISLSLIRESLRYHFTLIKFQIKKQKKSNSTTNQNNLIQVTSFLYHHLDAVTADSYESFFVFFFSFFYLPY